jgi:hypothetical protein
VQPLTILLQRDQIIDEQRFATLTWRTAKEIIDHLIAQGLVTEHHVAHLLDCVSNAQVKTTGLIQDRSQALLFRDQLIARLTPPVTLLSRFAGGSFHQTCRLILALEKARWMEDEGCDISCSPNENADSQWGTCTQLT